MNMALGTHLGTLRKNAGLSIDDLSRILDVPTDIWTRVELNRINPDKRMLLKAADYFNQPAADLLSRSLFENLDNEKEEAIKGKPLKSSLIKDNASSIRRIQNFGQHALALKRGTYTAKFFAPPEDLRGYLESVVYCLGHDLSLSTERILPECRPQLIISLRDKGRSFIIRKNVSVNMPGALVGIQQLPVTSYIPEGSVSIYVRFKPGGLYAFSGIDQRTFYSPVTAAETVFGQEKFHALVSQLKNNLYPEDAARTVFRFLSANQSGSGSPDPIVQYFIDHSREPLARIHSKTGYSNKYMTLQVKKHTGMTPKLFQRVTRFNNLAAEIISCHGSIDWGTLVCNHGYHDHAHLIKEFREFSGWSPTEFLSMGATCSRYIHFKER